MRQKYEMDQYLLQEFAYTAFKPDRRVGLNLLWCLITVIVRDFHTFTTSEPTNNKDDKVVFRFVTRMKATVKCSMSEISTNE